MPKQYLENAMTVSFQTLFDLSFTSHPAFRRCTVDDADSIVTYLVITTSYSVRRVGAPA